MSRDADHRIADVLQAIDRCQRYLGAVDGDGVEFVAMAEDAIERNLQIMQVWLKGSPSSGRSEPASSMC